MDIDIVIASEKIGEWLGIPITNTLLTGWIAMAILIAFAFAVSRMVAYKPGKIQNAIEALFSFVLDFMTEAFEGNRKRALFFFPLIATIFLFVWLANWMEFIPGFGSIGFTGDCGKAVCEPLFRSANTDLNATIALALIAVAVTEVAGIASLGLFRYAGKFFVFTSPLKFFIGLIELVSEASRLISFSFRLFGNIFAGEVLILVMMYFLPVGLPVPFMLFEMFVGFMQAAIFALLTLFFIKFAMTPSQH